MSDILFACVHNIGRSQMAKALLNTLASRSSLPYRAESAGTEPAETVHTNASEAMREIDVELTHARPQMMTSEMVAEACRVELLLAELQREDAQQIKARAEQAPVWILP